VALILKLAIAPPVELIVKPVAVVLTVLLSEDAERVNAGAAVHTGYTVVSASVVNDPPSACVWLPRFVVDQPETE
jgi:hypothetical protein